MSKDHKDRCRIVIKGGRDGQGVSPSNNDPETRTRGVDIAVYARSMDDTMLRLPVHSLVLRVDGRRAYATVELVVDEVDVSGIHIIEKRP